MNDEFVKLKEDVYTEINTKLAVDHILAKIIHKEIALTNEERRAIERVIASYYGVYDFSKIEELVREQMILKLSGIEDVFGGL